MTAEPQQLKLFGACERLIGSAVLLQLAVRYLWAPAAVEDTLLGALALRRLARPSEPSHG